MRFAFISAMASHPWGGSEELWCGAALKLTQLGHKVGASVQGWEVRHPRLVELEQAGGSIFERAIPAKVVRMSRIARMIRRLGINGNQNDPFSSWLSDFRPDLACVSNGNFKDGLCFLERINQKKIPYVSIIQANAEFLWPTDVEAQRLISVYRDALEVHCVSQGNLELLQNQLGVVLERAQVVFNPFQSCSQPLPWPSEESGFRLACVGRLEPDAKGQDLLFQVLARDEWRNRPLKLTLFGRGSSEAGLRRLVAMLGLQDRVHFAGHVEDLCRIWEHQHALVLPSRYEGMPIALQEAMACGRLPIVTDVAGNRELVTHGVNGFVAEAPTVFHLSRALNEAWERRFEWEHMGRAAKATALEKLPKNPCEAYANALIELTNCIHDED